ncbi:porin family protein [Phocaeicola dorei]|nr:porin family protein [Phocaeicola dorei]
MKTKILKHRAPKRILIGVLLVLFCFTSKAQIWENVHFNVDWQMNMPLNSNFADKFSGWGMNFEGKYDLTPYWSIGAFLNFHTNHRYVDRQTIPPHPNGFIDNRPATIGVPTSLWNICILQVTG